MLLVDGSDMVCIGARRDKQTLTQTRNYFKRPSHILLFGIFITFIFICTGSTGWGKYIPGPWISRGVGRATVSCTTLHTVHADLCRGSSLLISVCFNYIVAVDKFLDRCASTGPHGTVYSLKQVSHPWYQSYIWRISSNRGVSTVVKG